MGDLGRTPGELVQCVLEDDTLRLPRTGVGRRDDRREPAGQVQIVEDVMQPIVEIRHHGQAGSVCRKFLQNRLDLRKHAPGCADGVVIEQGIKKCAGLRDLGRQPTAVCRFPDHRAPPDPLRLIAVPIRRIIRGGQHPKDLPKRLADQTFLHHESRVREMAGVNGGNGLGRFDEGTGSVEKDGSGRAHECGMPARQRRPDFPAKSRFHLQVKDFRDTRSAAQASSARWEWV